MGFSPPLGTVYHVLGPWQTRPSWPPLLSWPFLSLQGANLSCCCSSPSAFSDLLSFAFVIPFPFLEGGSLPEDPSILQVTTLARLLDWTENLPYVLWE